MSTEKSLDIANRELALTRQLLGNAQKSLTTTISEISYELAEAQSRVKLLESDLKNTKADLNKVSTQLNSARIANASASETNQTLSVSLGEYSRPRTTPSICQLVSDHFASEVTDSLCEFHTEPSSYKGLSFNPYEAESIYSFRNVRDIIDARKDFLSL